MPQNTINRAIAPGMPGEIAYAGGESVQVRTVYGVGPDNPVIGLAYTEDGNGTAIQGGAGGIFAGILVAPKSYDKRERLYQTNYTIDSGSAGQLFRSGFGGIWVNLSSTSATIGDQVAYSTTDGSLVNVAPGATAPSGYALIPNAKVDYTEVSGTNPVLAIIKILGV